MPLRAQVHQACQRCREKRTKCSGELQCTACKATGIDCVYAASRHKSKDDLRSEIARLKDLQQADDVLLDVFLPGANIEACNFVLRALLSGESRQSICQKLASGEDLKSPSRAAEPQSDSSHQSYTSPETPGSLYTMTTYSPQSPVPAPLYLKEPKDEDDLWAPSRWPKSYKRELIITVLARNFFPSCFLCNDLFLQGYESGTGEQYSPALVAALLSLATRHASNDVGVTHEVSLAYLAASDMFFNEATAILQNNYASHNLANIQTLGILSLFQVSVGRTIEAQELVEEFARAITNFCLSESCLGFRDSNYTRARAATYCGAISLARTFHLVIGHVEHSSHSCLHVTAKHLGIGSGACIDFSRVSLDSRLAARWPQLDDPQYIIAKVFELTEWVYKLFCAEILHFEEVVEVYVKCLEWYSHMFLSARAGGDDETPFDLYIHTYFHFCILVLFNSFDDAAVKENGYIHPRKICRQAAHNILDLAQVYGKLPTSACLPEFLPYFISASASFLESGKR